MPKSVRRESSTTSATDNAGKIAKLAIGDETENSAVVSPGAALGKLGGQARARNMTPEQRAQQAKKAAIKRWETKKS